MCITKSKISMHTCRSFMSDAPQGTFVVIPEISHSDISYLIKNLSLYPRTGYYLRCHLVCRKIRPLSTMPTHRCPLTLACVRRYSAEAFPTALCGPFAAPLNTPLPATGALWRCASDVISASTVYGLIIAQFFPLSRKSFGLALAPAAAVRYNKGKRRNGPW